ncbi:organic cation transporter protein-like [Lineus longissimus]|uniref:organic cation transporter protein-like n=1 Tax=Lineus longissimus TaxID=88925 RepID=UPI002B4F0ECA
MEFDQVLSLLGQLGKYQVQLFFAIALPTMSASLLNLSAVFIMAAPDFRCAIPGLENDTYTVQDDHHQSLINATIPRGETCKIYSNTSGVNRTTQGCSAWVYDTSVFLSTAVTDFNLVCEYKILSSVVTMAFMFGMLVGGFVCGRISDKFGRLTVIVVGSVLQGISGLAFAFSVNIYMLIGCRFLMGFFGLGIYASCFVYVLEIVGPDRRTAAGIGQSFYHSLANVLITLPAYFIRDWVYLSITLSSVSFLVIPYWWLFPESPRWQIAKGRKKEAVKFIRKAAKTNRKIIPEKIFEELDLAISDDQPKGSLLDVLKSGVMLRRTAIVCLNWGAIAMGYYGLSLNSGNMVGDIFVNFLISGAIEIPAGIFALVALDRIGRRGVHVFCMILGGLGCLATIPVVIFADSSLSSWLLIVLSNVGKFGLSAGFKVMYVYTAELYHTTVRSAAIGINSISARMFSMAAPYIADLGVLIGGNFSQVLPQIVFGSAGLIAGIFAVFLPETLNTVLPKTLEDAIALGNKKKHCNNEAHFEAANPAFVKDEDVNVEMKEMDTKY